MSKRITLDIQKPKSNLLRFADTEVQVDHDFTGFIYEVRVWNDWMDEFVPVQISYLEKFLTSRFEKIKEQVLANIEGETMPQYNNDDLPPVA